MTFLKSHSEILQIVKFFKIFIFQKFLQSLENYAKRLNENGNLNENHYHFQRLVKNENHSHLDL